MELSAALKSRPGRQHTSNQQTTASSTITWAPTPTTHQQQGSEIDRIMAKIEQARLSIANVCVLNRNLLFFI